MRHLYFSMYNIKATQKLGELELKEGFDGHRSWHHQFRNSAYIFIGGLNQGLTEGDVVIVFSQFGEIVDVNLVRDKTTGKSKGFAFICYEDQRSTTLAVDNMNGSQLANRTLRVDHVDKYKAPKNFDEDEKDEDGDPVLLEYKATGAEGLGQHVHNITEVQKKISEIQSQKHKVVEQSVPEDEDEAWAKSFEESLKRMDAGSNAGKKDTERLKDAKKEIKNIKKEAKKLKKETQKAKKEAKRRRKERKEQKDIKQECPKRKSVKLQNEDDESSRISDRNDSEDSESSISSTSNEKRSRKKLK